VLGRISGEKNSYTIYDRMVEKHIKEGMAEEAEELVKKWSRTTLTSEAYIPIVKYFLARGMISQALDQLNLMKKLGIKPVQKIYNILIEGCAQREVLECVEELIEKMEDSGMNLDYEIYPELVTAYANKGKMKQAIAIFDIFSREKGNEKEAIAKSYEALIYAWVTQGKHSETMELIKEMMENGLILDVALYNVIIKECTKAGKMDVATQIYEMLKNKQAPNLRTFSMLVFGWIHKGELEKALQIFNQMKHFQISPSLEMYNRLVCAFLDKKMINEASDMVQLITNCGLKPRQKLSDQIYNSPIT